MVQFPKLRRRGGDMVSRATANPNTKNESVIENVKGGNLRKAKSGIILWLRFGSSGQLHNPRSSFLVISIGVEKDPSLPG